MRLLSAVLLLFLATTLAGCGNDSNSGSKTGYPHDATTTPAFYGPLGQDSHALETLPPWADSPESLPPAPVAMAVE